MIVKLLTEHHLELLSLKGGCTGSSESTLVKMSEISCRGSITFYAHKIFLSGSMDLVYTHTVNILKFRKLFSFSFSQIGCGLSRLEFTKCLSE